MYHENVGTKFLKSTSTFNKPHYIKSRKTVVLINIVGLNVPQCCVCNSIVCSGNLTFMWPCIMTNFLIIKPSRCTNSSNLFWNETLHVSDSSSVHHQELFIVHTAMVYDTSVIITNDNKVDFRNSLDFAMIEIDK